MIGRLLPVALGVAVGSAIGVLAIGGPGGIGVVGVAVPTAAAAVGGARLRSRRTGRRGEGERPWAPAVPAAPVARPPASQWAIARAMGRVEARELLVSGSYGVGLGFCALIIVLFGLVWSPQNTNPWFDLAPEAPWYCLPLVGLTVVSAHRSVTRAGRDGVAELLDTCPVPPATRTVGFLLAGVTPVVTLTVFLAALFALIGLRSPHMYGALSVRDWSDLAAAVLLGAGGVALGVALGRWFRFGLVPAVAVVAVGVADLVISGVGGRDWNRYSVLSMSPTIEWDSPVFQARAAGWHLLWVLGLSALVALIAVARHRLDRTVGALAVLVAVVVAVAGVGATRPMSTTDARRIAVAVGDPAAVQECTPTGPVSLCLYPVHGPARARMLEEIGPIAAALPDSAGPLTIRQRYQDELADLPPEVRRLLDEDDLLSPPGEVAINLSQDVGHVHGTIGFQLSLGAVGLPTRPDRDTLPTVVAGQARGVVALWLATRGRDASDTVSLTSSPNPFSLDPFERGSLEGIGECITPAVVWSGQDLAAARGVVDLPDERVRRVLAADWARWVDPSTATDDLLAALGLAGVGPADDVQARPGNPC